MRELIRKAGQAIRDFDDAYAARVRKDSGYLPMTQMLGGLPIGKLEVTPGPELALEMAREIKGPVSKGAIQRHQALEAAMGAGVIASNAGYRYGLPAAGVTLAGKGLYDLAVQYGGQADQPEPNQLTM